MNLKETVQVLSIIRSIYPSSDSDAEMTAKVWAMLFSNDSAEEVLKAVKECLSTMHFEPKPADIKARMYKSDNTIPAIALWEQARHFWRYELTDDIEEDERRYKMLAPEIRDVYSLSEMKEMRNLKSADVTQFEQPRFLKRLSEVRNTNHEVLAIEGGKQLVRIE